MIFKNSEKEVETYRQLVEPVITAFSNLENACRSYFKAQNLIGNLTNVKDEERGILSTTLERQIMNKENEIERLEKKVYVAGSIIESVAVKNQEKRQLTDELDDLRYGLDLFTNPNKIMAELKGDISSYETTIKENLAELDKHISKMKKYSGKFMAEKNLNAILNGDITEITEKIKGLSKDHMYILTLCDGIKFKSLEFYNPSEKLAKC